MSIVRIKSLGITDGTIVNADINASAGIDSTKISGLSSDYVLLQTVTASSSASVSWNSSYITSTYPIYKLFVINAVPATDTAEPEIGLSTNNLTNIANFDQRSMGFRAIVEDGGTNLLDQPSQLEQTDTAYTSISDGVGNATGEAFSSEITFYNLSGTTVHKYWTSWGVNGHSNDYSGIQAMGAHIFTTSAVNGLAFRFSTGNISSGIFKLYGVK